MALMEPILARRILPLLCRRLAEEQYAFRGARCTVVILADLGGYVMDFMWRDWITYAAGLDVAGAVGRAPLSSWYKRYRVLKSSSPFAGLLAPCCPREVLEYS